MEPKLNEIWLDKTFNEVVRIEKIVNDVIFYHILFSPYNSNITASVTQGEIDNEFEFLCDKYDEKKILAFRLKYGF